MEKIFEILFVVIMSVGVLGLPLYFYLMFRRKRLLDEYENKDIWNDGTDENKDDNPPNI